MRRAGLDQPGHHRPDGPALPAREPRDLQEFEIVGREAVLRVDAQAVAQDEGQDQAADRQEQVEGEKIRAPPIEGIEGKGSGRLRREGTGAGERDGDYSAETAAQEARPRQNEHAVSVDRAIARRSRNRPRKPGQNSGSGGPKWAS